MGVITLAQHKGGTGKTTTCANLGVALAEQGKSVLLVDLDHQCSLSICLGINLEAVIGKTINEVLHPESPLPIRQAIIPTDFDVDIVPSDIQLSGMEYALFMEMNRENFLYRALRPVRDRYDYILIDCPPSLGLLTINAMRAADHILIPLQCAYLALRGMRQLFDSIEKVRERMEHRDLDIIGILVTMFDSRTLHSREVLETVQRRYASWVFQTIIKKSVRFDDASTAGVPLVSFYPKSEHAKAYRELAKEVMNRAQTEESR